MAAEALPRITVLLRAGRGTEAEALARAFVEQQPANVNGRFVFAEALITRGRIAEALAQLDEAVKIAGGDPRAWSQLVVFYTQLGRHERAADCARTLERLLPESADALFTVASALTAVGETDEASAILDRIIASNPAQAEAYYTRATLRRQGRDAKHIDELTARLAAIPDGSPDEVPLCYALGKEYEDLGLLDQSFAHFAPGADARRRGMRYDVATDVAAIDAIIDTFDKAWRDRTAPGSRFAGPIFVLGLPRSGTTLVDRILDAHPEVTSLGEVNDFAYAVMRAGGAAANKEALIRQLADADAEALGEEYWRALRGYGENAPFLIDKTPANYLYLGLILQSLPGARVIHLRRHPMASAYAMYKMLFRMGYPFSYDFDDIARYYAAYRRLMDHWHELWPGRILDVDYEALVDDPDAASRRIVAHCGLDWSPRCLEYFRDARPTATASAVQVREPVHRRARDLWRKLGDELEPLRKNLEEQGITGWE